MEIFDERIVMATVNGPCVNYHASKSIVIVFERMNGWGPGSERGKSDKGKAHLQSLGESIASGDSVFGVRLQVEDFVELEVVVEFLTCEGRDVKGEAAGSEKSKGGTTKEWKGWSESDEERNRFKWTMRMLGRLPRVQRRTAFTFLLQASQFHLLMRKERAEDHGHRNKEEGVIVKGERRKEGSEKERGRYLLSPSRLSPFTMTSKHSTSFDFPRTSTATFMKGYVHDEEKSTENKERRKQRGKEEGEREGGGEGNLLSL